MMEWRCEECGNYFPAQSLLKEFCIRCVEQKNKSTVADDFTQELKRPAILFKRLSETAVVPQSSNYFAAGLDLFAPRLEHFEPGKITVVPLQIASIMSRGIAALLWDRSSMAVAGLHIFAGVIDCDYEGEWKVVVYNSTDQLMHCEEGDRIAQALIQRVERPNVREITERDYGNLRHHSSNRGIGGFGSTGG